MKLVTRAQLGWPASAAPSQSTAKGVKVHYEGTPVSTKLLADHDACLAEWQAIRKSHLANKVENYSDVAYNYAACPHGYLLEGRGLGKRTGANGNQTLNQAHYAIVGLLGSSGLTEPNDAMLGAIRDGIDLLRQHGAGTEIKGHRDGYATACPGGPLYTWVQKGAPRPGGTAPDDTTASGTYTVKKGDTLTAIAAAHKTTVVALVKLNSLKNPNELSIGQKLKVSTTAYEPFPGASWFTTGRKSPIVLAMRKRLIAVGCNHYQSSKDPDVIGSGDKASYEAWQRKCGYTGAAATWPPGKTTWDKLQVPK
ncbi:peptidoglycan-binding protein [Streptomyces halstedii]|uniref:peptidoglycan-binding protein n=1 Tax=Streptomyces halstedii TaxID=1944 RepID=UPI00381E867D